jgi:hypothetical protein
MSIERFVSGKGWIIDPPAPGSLLVAGDVLIIGWLGDIHVLLLFKRKEKTVFECRATYANVDGDETLSGPFDRAHTLRLSFTGAGVLKVDINPRSEGGPSPNGGGTSSGPGGN